MIYWGLKGESKNAEETRGNPQVQLNENIQQENLWS